MQGELLWGAMEGLVEDRPWGPSERAGARMVWTLPAPRGAVLEGFLHEERWGCAVATRGAVWSSSAFLGPSRVTA